MVKKGQISNWSIDMFTVILLFSKSCLAHPLTKLDAGVQMNIIRGNFKTVMRQVFTCFHMIRRRKKFYAKQNCELRTMVQRITFRKMV